MHIFSILKFITRVIAVSIPCAIALVVALRLCLYRPALVHLPLLGNALWLDNDVALSGYIGKEFT